MKEIFEVSGMSCRSCELRIEEKVRELKLVRKVKANTQKGEVQVFSDKAISRKEIESKIIEAGYAIGKKESSFISKDPTDYKIIFFSMLIITFLYYAGSYFGFGKFFSYNAGSSTNLFVVFGIGLTAGLSTCMALVGGLILGVSARYAEKHPDATASQKFRPHLFFNLGRIISYFVLGGVIGEIGSVLKLSGTFLGIITLFVAMVMITLGLQLTELFPRLQNGFTLPKGLSRFLKINDKKEKEYSHLNSAILGALTFFLPCGFTQAMQVYAISTGNFWSGALIMSVFALGTAPGLLGIGGLTSFLKKGTFGQVFYKFVGVLVVALGLFNLSNGLNLTGLKSYLAVSEKKPTQVETKVENGVQVVKMEQNSYGYKPNRFTIKKGIPVRWEIDSKDLSTCASSVVVPKLGIEKIFTLGQNVIEFTPKETGKITFSCAMGMYTGYFNVVE